MKPFKLFRFLPLCRLYVLYVFVCVLFCAALCMWYSFHLGQKKANEWTWIGCTDWQNGNRFFFPVFNLNRRTWFRVFIFPSFEKDNDRMYCTCVCELHAYERESRKENEPNEESKRTKWVGSCEYIEMTWTLIKMWKRKAFKSTCKHKFVAEVNEIERYSRGLFSVQPGFVVQLSGYTPYDMNGKQIYSVNPNTEMLLNWNR